MHVMKLHNHYEPERTSLVPIESLAAGQVLRGCARSPARVQTQEMTTASTLAPLRWLDPPEGPAIELLDQTRLPGAEALLTCRDVPQLVGAIRRLAVRGAPMLGVAAAYGVALAAARDDDVAAAAAAIARARPTAANLAWGADRALDAWRSAVAGSSPVSGKIAGAQAALAEAKAIAAADAAASAAIAAHGLDMVNHVQTVRGYGGTGRCVRGGDRLCLGEGGLRACNFAGNGAAPRYRAPPRIECPVSAPSQVGCGRPRACDRGGCGGHVVVAGRSKRHSIRRCHSEHWRAAHREPPNCPHKLRDIAAGQKGFGARQSGLIQQFDGWALRRIQPSQRGQGASGCHLLSLHPSRRARAASQDLPGC